MAAVAGAVTAALLGLLGFLFKDVVWSWLSNDPPVAEIAPASAVVSAFDTIEFSAAGSHDPDDETLTFTWRAGIGVNGDCVEFRPNQDDWARPLLSCRFIAPGNYIVSVIVEDDDGARDVADAEVEVVFDPSEAEDYFALVARPKTPGLTQGDAYRVLLKAVNWPAVQSSIRQTIVLFDYDASKPVLARHAVQDVPGAMDIVAKIPLPRDLGVDSYGLIGRVKDSIEADLLSVGLNQLEIAATGELSDLGEGPDVAIDAGLKPAQSLEEAEALLRTPAPTGAISFDCGESSGGQSGQVPSNSVTTGSSSGSGLRLEMGGCDDR